MKMKLCSRCKKNIAVVFLTKIENGEVVNDGLCLKCARQLGIRQVQDVMDNMGITDDDLDNIEAMTEQAGLPVDESGETVDLIPAGNEEEENDNEQNTGGTASFPFIQNIFGQGAQGDRTPPPPPPRGGRREPTRK